MTLRDISSILATTDFHSSLDAAPALLAHLEEARPTSLIVDCGDFFEGTGYYRPGDGALETQILDRFYDVLAPGNHGWSHYLSPLLRPITVCANVVDSVSTVFRPLFVTDVGGRRIGITGIIGAEAFETIPARERYGHIVLDPAQRLNALFQNHQNAVDRWVLLSHAGFAHDLALAEACPWLDVIFSGHCHSPNTGLALVGRTAVVKASELGRGVAVAHLRYSGWTSTTSLIPANGVPSSTWSVKICREVDRLTVKLSEPCGRVHSQWADSEVDRDVLAERIALAVCQATGQVSLINHTALRSHRLGAVLTLGDLAVVEPFDAQLVALRFPEPQNLAELIALVEPFVGKLAVAPSSLPETVTTLVTTTYIADTFVVGPTEQTPGDPLSNYVASVLCEEPERRMSS